MQRTTVYRNCFIPKDGSLRHCHVTVENTRVRHVEIVSDSDHGKLMFEEKFGDYVRISDASEYYGREDQDHENETVGDGDGDENEEQDQNRVNFFVFECAGKILSPGFIDIQLNGAFGVDFSNPAITKDDVLGVATKLTKHGVTHFCPTMVSSSKSTYAKVIPLIGGIALMDRQSSPSSKSSELTGRASLELGMHLEGPFFAASKRGAHEADCICEDMKQTSIRDVYGRDIKHLYSKAGVSIVTLAPELPGAGESIQTLSQNNITVSMGHTEAAMEDGIKARKCGAKLLTHLFNAMRPFHHREPGLLGLLQYSEDSQTHHDLYYSIIADGLHSHPISVKTAFALSQNAVLVTDAMSAMGLGDGHHTLGSEAVTVKNDRAVIRGTNTLAGSVASMDSCVRSFKKFTGCTHYEALRAATINPAKVLGKEEDIAFVRPDSLANFVLLDDDLNVLRTIVNGCIVYSSTDERSSSTADAMKGRLARPTLPCKRKQLN